MTTETLMTIDEVRDWLKRNDRNPAWLARQAGLDRKHLWRVVRGDRPLTGEVSRKVTRAIERWNSSPA